MLILIRILLLIVFTGSMLMTIGGIGVYRDSKLYPSIAWSYSQKICLFIFCVVDILSFAAYAWIFYMREGLT